MGNTVTKEETVPNILTAIDGLRPAHLTKEYRVAGRDAYDQVAPYYTGEKPPSTDILGKLTGFVELAEFITVSYMTLELALELSLETLSDFKKSAERIIEQFGRVFPDYDLQSLQENKIVEKARGERQGPESLSVSRSAECLRGPVKELPDVLSRAIPVLEKLEGDGAEMAARVRGIQYLIKTRNTRIRDLVGQISPDHAESALSDYTDGKTVTLEEAFGRLGD